MDEERDGFALGRSVELNDGGGIEVGAGQFDPVGFGALDADAAEHRQRGSPGDDLAQTRKGGLEFCHGQGDGIHDVGSFLYWLK